MRIWAFVPATGASLLELRREAVSEAVTDAKGSAYLALPALDKVVLILDDPAHAPMIFEVAPAPDLVLSFRLDPAVPLRGAVLSLPPAPEKWAGTICASWSVQIPVLRRPHTFERCAAMQPSGRFDLAGVDRGAAGELTVRVEGFLPHNRRLPADLSRPLRLLRGELVEGIVLRSGDRPVADATLRNAAGDETRSKEDGRFSLRVPSLPAKLVVLATGFRRAEIPVPAPSREKPPLRVVLSPGPTLEARVLGGEGKPLGRVAIRLLRETPATGWRAENLEAILEKKGDLRLDLPQPGRYRFELRSPGLKAFRSEPYVVAPAQGVSLGVVNLSAGGGVEGRVVDAQSGAPLAGVLLSLWPQGLSGSQRLGGHLLGQGVTDREGRYRIAGQDEGAYEVRFERRPLASTYREVLLAAETLTALSDEAMGAGVPVHGRVRTLGGKPKAAVSVRFLALSGSSRLPVAEARTAADGRFDGLRLAPGPYRLEVHGDRILLAQAVEIAPEAAADSEGLDLHTAETTLSGVVLRAGEPIPGGLLALGPSNLADRRLGMLVLQTPEGGSEVLGGPAGGTHLSPVDDEGTFHFEDAPPGHLLLTYTSPEGRTWTRTADLAPAGESFLRLELGGKGVAGVVVDKRTAEPIEGAAIAVRDALGQPLASLISGPDGTFATSDLAVEAIRAEAAKPGFRSALLEARLTEGAAPLRFELEAADAGKLTVRLQQASGQPLAFTFVTVLTASGAMVRSLPLDAQGEKRFEGLTSGSYRVAWSDPASGLGVSAPLTVQGGEETLFERVMQEPAQLEITCPPAACSRKPLEGLNLFSVTPVDLVQLLTGFAPGLAFSAEGRLSLGALQPGPYELAVQLGGRVSHFRVEALPGQRLTLPLGELTARTSLASP